MSDAFKAFADEMEKIATSDQYFMARAMNAIHKSPTSRVPSQMARALLTANRKGFTESRDRILSLFKEWKEHGRHPGPAPKLLDGVRRAAAKKPAPASSPTAASPSAPKSWKKKALLGAAAASVPAAAYGVHKYNKKKLSAE